MSLLELFCAVDDFYIRFAAWLSQQQLETGNSWKPANNGRGQNCA